MKFGKLAVSVAASCAAFAAFAAYADFDAGVTLSATGRAASLGIPEKNTIVLLPTTMGGQKVNYIDQEFVKRAETYKLKVVANERYSRADTSVTGQVLKIMAAKPDVLVAGSGTPGR